MDPTAALSRVEQRLLHVVRHRGRRRFMLAVTAISVALSLGLTAAVMAATNTPPMFFAIGMVIALVVPCVVAPIVSSSLSRVLMALDQVSAELRHLSRTDSLTGVLNRRAFADAAEALLQFPRHAVLVAMVDIDDFKAVNDHHGHATGDRALKTLAAKLVDAIGGDGVVGRLGGDEFAVIADISSNDAGSMLEVLRAACDLSWMLPGLSASIGATVTTQPVSLNEALAQADHQLYRTKSGERRR